MSKKALYLLGIAIVILSGSFFYPKLCCSCMKPVPIDSVEKPIATASDGILK